MTDLTAGGNTKTHVLVMSVTVQRDKDVAICWRSEITVLLPETKENLDIDNNVSPGGGQVDGQQCTPL